MALSDEWTEWHLTRTGWVRGSNRVDIANTTRVADPEGSVAVYRYREYQSSMFDKQERSTERLSGNEGDPVVADLLAQFGPCPNRLF